MVELQLVKIFGERNTSTNALKNLIELNFSCKVLPGGIDQINSKSSRFLQGFVKFLPSRKMEEALKDWYMMNQSFDNTWKHRATYFRNLEVKPGRLVYFTVRHPASWVISLYSNPYQILGSKSTSIGDFLNMKIKPVKREVLPAGSFTPLELYEEKLRSYLLFFELLDSKNINYRVIKFEDLILQQERVLKTISGDLSFPNGDQRLVTQSTKDESKSLGDYVEYYSEERWREKLPENFFVQHSFDEKLLASFKYEWK